MKVYKFGNCYLDAVERRVFKNDQLVELTPRAFDILHLLVEERGRVVTKEDLIERVWNNSFVEEGNIPVHVSKLRKLLASGGSEPFIETVRGTGYHFVSRVQTVTEEEWGRYLEENASASGSKDAADPELDSLAVLPFQNAGGSQEAEYLAEGLTESVINNLSYLREIKVLARSTVFRFKDSPMEAREVGATLGVAAVLTGRVRLVGENIVVGAELMKVSDGTQLWGQQFNRPFSDIFEIQESIARSISEKLRLQIGDLAKKSIRGQTPQNIKAYTLYLKGRHFWTRKNLVGINTAIKYFQESISVDPTYVAPYIGLADCYIGLYLHEEISRNKTLSLVSILLKNLPKFGVDDSEILSINGFTKLYLEWDWNTAESCYQKSLALNPNNSIPRIRYAQMLAFKGQFAESLAQHQLALLLDPLSIMTNASLGRVFYFMEQYDNAIQQLEETLELDPTNYVSLGVLGVALAAKGKYSEALNTFLTSQRYGKTIEIDSLIGYVQALSGAKNEARKKIKQIEEQVNTKGKDPTNAAVIYVALGEFDKAIESFEKAYSQRRQELIGIKADPRLKPIRQHPQFKDLVRRIGLSVD